MPRTRMWRPDSASRVGGRHDVVVHGELVWAAWALRALRSALCALRRPLVGVSAGSELIEGEVVGSVPRRGWVAWAGLGRGVGGRAVLSRSTACASGGAPRR